MAKAEKKKQCFVVGPIGDDDSDDRVHADWLLEEVIQPVFEQHFKDFDVNRADKISDPGRIDAQIITALLEADLVIADLTTLNPNAFYEIGIRHTVQKPIIHMHLEGQRIPFDIASFRSIKFQRKWPRDLRRARDTLKQAVEAATAPGHFVDNPVTFSRGKFEIAESATPADKVLFDEIESITARLERIEFGFLREYGFDTTRRKAFHVIKIKAKNSSPDKDVQTAVRPVMRKLAIVWNSIQLGEQRLTSEFLWNSTWTPCLERCGTRSGKTSSSLHTAFGPLGEMKVTYSVAETPSHYRSLIPLNKPSQFPVVCPGAVLDLAADAMRRVRSMERTKWRAAG